MQKLFIFITTAIVLTSCWDNSTKNNIPKEQQLPLSYDFNGNAPRPSIKLEGVITVEKDCFYFGRGDERMAVAFPSSFQWNKDFTLVETGDRTISSGQTVVTDGGMISREDFLKKKGYYTLDETCLTTERILLLHKYFG